MELIRSKIDDAVAQLSTIPKIKDSLCERKYYIWCSIDHSRNDIGDDMDYDYDITNLDEAYCILRVLIASNKRNNKSNQMYLNIDVLHHEVLNIITSKNDGIKEYRLSKYIEKNKNKRWKEDVIKSYQRLQSLIPEELKSDDLIEQANILCEHFSHIPDGEGYQHAKNNFELLVN